MQRVEGSIEPQGMRGCEHAAYGVAKRQRRRVELREEAAHRPPVAREAVALAADLLGRHELGRAAQRERPLHAHLQTVGGGECRQTRGGRKSREDVGWSRSASE